MLAQSFLPYAKQKIEEDDIQAVAEALRGDWITRGPLVEQFEQAVADYCGARFGVAFNSGSSALDACYWASEVSSQDRVFSTPNTFVATVGPALRRGAKVFFGDIDPSTGNLSLESLQELLEPYRSRGRDILAPVHFAGRAIPMRELERLVKDPDAVIIEDGSHALGAVDEYGDKVGSCAKSDMTVFSFHPAKNMTTGEGGMVTTDNPELARRLRLFRNNGMERDENYLRVSTPSPWNYEVQDLTGNFHMTELQAALGLSQLKKLDRFIAERRQWVAAYREQLRGVNGISLSPSDADETSAHHLFVVQIDFEALSTTRRQVMDALREKGVGTQVHYIPLYYHPACPRTESAGREGVEAYYRSALSLPLYVGLGLEGVQRVVESLKEVLGVTHQ